MIVPAADYVDLFGEEDDESGGRDGPFLLIHCSLITGSPINVCSNIVL
jgi:hypothetical protein